MRETIGDLWEHDVIVVPTNGETTQAGLAVMGAGVARQAKRRYPSLPEQLGWWLEQRGNRPGVFVQRDRTVITFPTKHEWRRTADPKLVLRSATSLARIATALGLGDVALPRVGCGHGGLRWEALRDRLDVVLDGRFVVVTREGEQA